MFQKFEYNGGRTFVVGDIHGEFDLLDQKLEEFDFDVNEDHLFSVGDLVDRGPQSELAIKYLCQPWFHAVRGNHEQMCIDAGGTYWHIQNGGQWFNELEENEQRKVIAAFKDLPYIIQFESPSGKQIGIVHAGFDFPKWKDLENIIEQCEMFERNNSLLWDRNQIRSTAHRPNEAFIIDNIDAIYCGHTPVKKPITVGNINWIDTGAFATGNLTVIEVS